MANNLALNSTPRLYKKVALVYDRVNKIGGAERVLSSLHRLFPDAPLFTLVYNPSTAPWSRSFKVIPTFLNRLTWFRTHHEVLAPVAALAFETFNFDSYDLVISVTSAEAKAVITHPNTFHLCYCLTPTRYLWSGQKDYPIPGFYRRLSQNDDLVYASRPDEFLAISREVQKRIKNYYHRSAAVIYPGINYKFFSAENKYSTDGYYLIVGRQVAYKKTEIVIRAFNQLKRKLLIVGHGSQLSYLQSIAGPTVDFINQPDDSTLRDLYQGAQAVIFPQVEDFGLIPLESQAAGTPVLAFAGGGALETIIPKKTGLFFHSQDPATIIKVVKEFETGNHAITAKNCRAQAKFFSEDRFIANFSAKVNSLWREYQKKSL